MCVRSVRYVNETGEPTGKILPNPIGENKIISSQELIREMMLNKFYPFQWKAQISLDLYTAGFVIL